MCQMVFVGADGPLPLIPWDKDCMAFHARVLDAKEDAVRTQFSKSHIYYLGGSEGCGCSFGEADVPLEILEPDALALQRKDIGALREYLVDALRVQGNLELYVVQWDDMDKPPLWRGSISPDEISGDSLAFANREFLVVQPWTGVRESQEAHDEQ